MAPIFTGNWFGFGRSEEAGASGPIPITATGGTKYTTPDGVYHVFNYTGSPASFSISSGNNSPFEVLIVAGGGSGANGGGGGGGIRFETVTSYTAPKSYTLLVGAGGPGSASGDGGDSNWDISGTPVLAGGGGGGTLANSGPGRPGRPVGGSGGGAGGGNSGPPRITGSASPGPVPWAIGYPGSPGGGPDFGAWGSSGGGAGGAGNPGTVVTPFPGGTVINSVGGNGGQVPTPFLPTNAPAPMQTALGGIPTGSPAWKYFSGGGTGGWYPNPGPPGWGPAPGAPVAGGIGGGGVGGQIGAAGGDGVNGRGGGGGGSGNNTYNAGGHGIIIVRYDL